MKNCFLTLRLERTTAKAATMSGRRVSRTRKSLEGCPQAGTNRSGPTSGPKYQPVKPRVIAKQLKLPSEQHKALKLAIRRLAKAGKVNYGAGHLVRAPKGKDKSKTLTPALSQRERESRTDNATRTGGETRTDGPSRSRESKNVIVGSFGGHRRALGSCGHKGRSAATRPATFILPPAQRWTPRIVNRCACALGKNQARGKGGALRQAGEIVEIVERETHQFVGVYKGARRHWLCRGRWQSLRSGGARRRSRREGGRAKRQGRDRDGPLSHAPAPG